MSLDCIVTPEFQMEKLNVDRGTVLSVAFANGIECWPVSVLR